MTGLSHERERTIVGGGYGNTGVVPRILVVEDDSDIARLVVRALERAGFTVDRAGDGPGGLALARAGEYALIVLDLRLPGIDGVTVLKEILETRPGQNVLVLSAMGEVHTKVRLLELRGL